MRQAGQVSKAISNRPELLPGLEIYLDAFYELHSDREDGKLISTFKVLEYARAYEFSSDTRDEMVTLIREMDIAFIAHKRTEAETINADAAEPSGKNGSANNAHSRNRKPARN